MLVAKDSIGKPSENGEKKEPNRISLRGLTRQVRVSGKNSSHPYQVSQNETCTIKASSDRILHKTNGKEHKATGQPISSKSVSKSEGKSIMSTMRSRSDSFLEVLNFKTKRAVSEAEGSLSLKKEDCVSIGSYLSTSTLSDICKNQPNVSDNHLRNYISQNKEILAWFDNFLSCPWIANNLQSHLKNYIKAINSEKEVDDVVREKIGMELFIKLFACFQQSKEGPATTLFPSMPEKLANTLNNIEAKLSENDSPQNAKLKITLWFFARYLNPVIKTIKSLEMGGRSYPVVECLEAYLPTITQLPANRVGKEFGILNKV